MNILVTVGAGFIGSNLIQLLLAERPHVEATNLDLLTSAGTLENLSDIQADPRHTFLRGDVCDGVLVRDLMAGKEAVLDSEEPGMGARPELRGRPCRDDPMVWDEERLVNAARIGALGASARRGASPHAIPS